ENRAKGNGSGRAGNSPNSVCLGRTAPNLASRHSCRIFVDGRAKPGHDVWGEELDLSGDAGGRRSAVYRPGLSHCEIVMPSTRARKLSNSVLRPGWKRPARRAPIQSNPMGAPLPIEIRSKACERTRPAA